MDSRPALAQARTRWSRIVVAAVLVLAPAAIAFVLFFGSGSVNLCLGYLTCASLPPPEQVPLIGSPAGLVTTIVALSSVWLGAAALTIGSLWSTDRARLGRAAATVAGLVLATAVVVVTFRLVEGQRLRVVAEDAGLYALGVAIIAVPVALVWALLTAGPGSTSARPRPSPGSDLDQRA